MQTPTSEIRTGKGLDSDALRMQIMQTETRIANLSGQPQTPEIADQIQELNIELARLNRKLNS